jgi:hypothetical protein
MEKAVGKVTRYFSRIGVAVVDLIAPVALGDEIIFRKGDSEVSQILDSMQVDNQGLESAKAGDSVGIETHEPVKVGAEVFKK